MIDIHWNLHSSKDCYLEVEGIKMIMIEKVKNLNYESHHFLNFRRIVINKEIQISRWRYIDISYVKRKSPCEIISIAL